MKDPKNAQKWSILVLVWRLNEVYTGIFALILLVPVLLFLGINPWNYSESDCELLFVVDTIVLFYFVVFGAFVGICFCIWMFIGYGSRQCSAMTRRFYGCAGLMGLFSLGICVVLVHFYSLQVDVVYTSILQCWIQDSNDCFDDYRNMTTMNQYLHWVNDTQTIVGPMLIRYAGNCTI
eukprot:288657_1